MISVKSKKVICVNHQHTDYKNFPVPGCVSCFYISSSLVTTIEDFNYLEKHQPQLLVSPDLFQNNSQN